MERRLKILYMVDNYYPIVGGISTVVDKSATALSEFADITIVTIKAKNYVDPPCRYKILRCRGFYNALTSDALAFPGLDKNFIKTLKAENFDIIHCHTPANLMNFAFKFGKKYNIPVIATIHSIFKPDIKHYVHSEWFANYLTSSFMKKTNKADYLWAVTKFCYDYVKPFGITKSARIMNNAIDLEAPTDVKDLRDYINKTYNISDNTFVMAFISRMVKVKNPDLVIDSVNLLKDKNLNFKVFFVGDGDYLSAVKKRVKSLDLENYFIFPGMIRDRQILQAFYARADVVLFPSYMDSAGLIQVEAAAFKKPTMVIENTAPAEKMIDYENGIISKNNAQDFSSKMLYAIANNDKLVEIGQRAYETLYRNYNDKKIIHELLGAYNEVLIDFKKKKK